MVKAKTIEYSDTKRRIILIDELRGFLILCMIFYHTLYSMCFLFNFYKMNSILFFFEPVQPLFAAFFILISGAVSQFSHSNLVRGLKLMGISLVITIATYFIMPRQVIVFGILHMLSFSMITYGIFDKALSNISIKIGLILSVVLFLATMNIGKGFIGISFFKVYIPDYLYNVNVLFPLGITTNEFFSADYFPIFPWIFVFLFGSFLGRFLKSGNLPQIFYEDKAKFLSFCGRNSLIIYLIHQPIICAILSIINFIF